MSFLSKSAILAVDDRRYEEVDVPEWGGKVLVRSLSGKERDQFETSTVSVNKKGQPVQNLENVRARLLAMSIVDPEDRSKLLFSQKEVAILGDKSARALQRIFNACQEINAITEDDVEELTESFDEDPAEASTSD
ncbi:hypothetical protein [Rhodococcus sp. 11-3]|uniref:hypothetical protein n=1 Tax=Rhodococcus sp. 11-3 TaxID=2854796 RepID=UPI00203BFC6B|nr:hypothetical protein [Rhodococcus sp. 11-3]USC17041.1 hypothetical protein KZJ41_09315 [Rhodococcus sp. 11-3]